MPHLIALRDACSGARLEVRPELITEVDACTLRLPSGEELPVSVVRVEPARLSAAVTTRAQALSLIVQEPAGWIREALESIARVRGARRRARSVGQGVQE